MSAEAATDGEGHGSSDTCLKRANRGRLALRDELPTPDQQTKR